VQEHAVENAALGAGWLTEPGLRHLFTEFPLPLAVVDLDRGQVLPNPRFDSLLDPSTVYAPPLRDLLAAPGLPWRAVSVPARGGGRVALRARALHTTFGAMLMLDDAHGGDPGGGPRFHELTTRIAELERASAIDRLTGLWNRAHFDRTIDAEIARSLRSEQPVSLLVLDVDHFKAINDRHGHAAGDTVLKEFARLLTGSTRACDDVFRWGGEEFAVLAPSAYGAAESLAESLRATVAAHPFPHAAPVTVSIGVAEHSTDEFAQEWFVRADLQVYAAKQGGRNRVYVDRRGSSDTWSSAGGALRLVWRPEYECGDSRIDTQHRELFRHANSLIGAVGRDARDPGVDVAFDRLLAHVVRHFGDEERLLSERNYARLASHARAHAGLVDRAETLRCAARRGDLTFATAVDFLAGEVVARHLLGADRDFFPLFGV
jgi:diguanylate cyclase (GGDEF)-like protein/hemerythrin-like metal-binding protein